MANRLQLKRGSGGPGSIFYAGEPIYDQSGKILYVGDVGGTGTGVGSSIASSATYLAALEMLYKSSSVDSGSIRLYEDTDNGTNYVAIAASAALASNYTLRLPDSAGSAGQVLKTDGSGNLAWVNQTAGYTGWTLSDGTTTQAIDSGNTVLIGQGEGIDVVVSATDTVTISGEAASTTNAGIASYTSDFHFINTWQVGVVTATSAVKGIASFDATDFTVTAGAVTVNAERVEDIVGAMVSGNTETNITVTYTDNAGAAGKLDFSVADATSAVKGVASFNTGDFTVTSGAVAIGNSFVSSVTTDSGSLVPTNRTLSILGGEGIDVTHAGTTITVAGEAGSTTNAGINSHTSDFYFINTWQVGLATALTGKTFDANGVGNAITNLEVADFAASAITTAAETITSNNVDTQIPTSAAVKSYVDGAVSAVDLTVTTAEGTNGTGGGGGSFNTSQTLTFNGTTNEVDVTVSGQSVTYGLPQDVTVSRDLTVTRDVTVNGNLRVVGTAVTFETQTVKVEDRLIELGLVNGAAPSASTTWDSGVVFNWHDGTIAKKSAVVWLDNAYVAFASSITTPISGDTGTTNADPQVTINVYAPVVSNGLYIGGIGAGNEVINSSQAAVNLTFDGGSY